MVVDDMASMPPRNKLLMRLQPKKWPQMEPKPIMQKMMVHAAMNGLLPIFNIFLKLNSRPRVNMRKMTPMSAHVCTLCMSVTDGMNWKCGLLMKPATM